MSFARLSFPLFFSVLLCVFPLLVVAQDSEEAAKTKQHRQTLLLEQIVADIPNMKLGENRALVYARLGNIVWKTDQNRARKFFQNAASELVNAQISAEADKKNSGFQYDLISGQTARPQILQTIAACDAELALEYLYKTRPAAITKAFSMASVKNSKISNHSNNYSYLVQNEDNLEQSFVRLAADQNPERAIKLLKESLKKGFSEQTLGLLKKLHEKDVEAADEIASEVVGKLIGINFNPQNAAVYQQLNVTTNFLTEFTRKKAETEKAVKFNESQMRGLADKLISFYLQQNNGRAYFNAYAIIPIAEKLAPSSVESLKKLQRNSLYNGFDRGYEFDPEVNKILGGEATAEQLLIEAKKFPVSSRRQIYQTAANKFAQQGDLNRATGILKDNFDDDALEQEIHNLNSQFVYSLSSAGKFTEAERVIDGFPENLRVNALTNLANAIYRKNPEENKSYAVAVLGKARSLISAKPEDTTEMSNLMQIISAYSAIEPVEAFRLFEPLIQQINELSEAAVIINGFQRNSNIKQGEFVITSGNSWGIYGAEFSVLSKLSTDDFERVLSLIDNFSRREMRVSLKLQLAENTLN
jgi:hypothetical protein